MSYTHICAKCVSLNQGLTNATAALYDPESPDVVKVAMRHIRVNIRKEQIAHAKVCFPH